MSKSVKVTKSAQPKKGISCPHCGIECDDLDDYARHISKDRICIKTRQIADAQERLDRYREELAAMKKRAGR